MRVILCSMVAVAAAFRASTDGVASLQVDTLLPECLTIPSFKKVVVDPDGTTSYSGQCEPSVTPGAYFTDDGKNVWQCWNRDTDGSVRNDEWAKTLNFAGACTFSDSQSKKSPDEVDVCPIDGFESCVTDDDTYWGACYTQGSSPSCILKTDPKKDGYVNGDCKGLPNRDHPDTLYESVCRIVPADVKTYKCETISVYSAGSATTCGGQRSGEDMPHSACFSSEKDVNWMCFLKQEQSLKAKTCVGIGTPKGNGHKYDGGCLFMSASGHEEATTWAM